MKHFKGIILIIILLALASFPAFGNEVTVNFDENKTLEDFIEMINPKIEENNDAYIKNNLFISLNIKEQAEMYLTLKRVVPVMDSIFMDKIMDGELEQDVFVENMTKHIMELHNKESETIALEEVIDEETPDETIDSEAPENTVGTEEQVIVLDEAIVEKVSSYIDAYIEKENLYKEYIRASKEIEVNESSIISQEGPLVVPESYAVLKDDYLQALKAYSQLKRKYDELFKVHVIKKDPIQSEGVMPFYEKTIESVKYGQYELIIEVYDEDGLVLDQMIDLSLKPFEEPKKDDADLDLEDNLIQPIESDELEE